MAEKTQTFEREVVQMPPEDMAFLSGVLQALTAMYCRTAYSAARSTEGTRTEEGGIRMNELNVTVIEQPGEICQTAAQRLCTFLLRYYAEHKEEIDAMVKEKEATA